jgi:hypothetical protein
MPRYIGHSTANTAGAVERATVSTSVTGTATLYLPLVSDVNDDSSSPRTMAAVGGAAISSAQKKFGAGSLYLDGVNDNLSISGTDWDFGTTNFTIDGWFYCTEDSSSTFLHIISTNATAGWNLCVKPSLKRIQFYENGTAFGADSCWTLNTWHHVAVVRQSTNLSVYVDGTSIVSTTISASEEFNTDAGSGGGVIFGAQWGGGSPFEGYLQDWRVLRGVVCYTANFIVPRVPRGDDNVNGNVTKTYTYAIENKWNSGVWSISGSGNNTVNTRRKAGKWATTDSRLPTVDLTFHVWGAGGGGSLYNYGNNRAVGGSGAYMSATYTAIVGHPLTIHVGGGGQGGYNVPNPGTMAGGWPDGGDGSYAGGTGGGSSLIKTPGGVVIIVGGAGGGGGHSYGYGGNAGYPSGTAGVSAHNEPTHPAGGGTQSAGGASNPAPGGNAGGPLSGGDGSTGTTHGAGGGGGFFGGGGTGSIDSGAGGGGSSYVNLAVATLTAPAPLYAAVPNHPATTVTASNASDPSWALAYPGPTPSTGSPVSKGVSVADWAGQGNPAGPPGTTGYSTTAANAGTGGHGRIVIVNPASGNTVFDFTGSAQIYNVT